LNPVNAVQGLEIYSGAHYSCSNVVINNSSASNYGLIMNNCKSVMLKGINYNDNINGAVGLGNYAFAIGQSGNSTTLVVDCDLDFTCHDAGQQGTPGALAIIDYARGCSFNLKHGNVD